MFAAILPFLPAITSLLGSAVQHFTGDSGDKVIQIVQDALGGSATAAQSVVKINGMLASGRVPTDAELDRIIADIKSNSQTIQDLAQQARNRDAD